MTTGVALIGHTGFVGSNLAGTGGYEHFYNSSNIEDMSGHHFRHIVCAGVSAVKWLANKEPDNDWRGIQRLIDALDAAAADRFTLIPTVDVFSRPLGVTEDSPPDAAAAYGRHRSQLEQWVRSRFPACQIVRLPGLFGPGLRKNILFDLAHDNGLEKIALQSRFQWYPVRRLHQDLETIHRSGIELVHIAPAPVPTGTIVDAFFPYKKARLLSQDTTCYDMHSNHPALFEMGSRHHQFSEDYVMRELAAFLGHSISP